MQHLGVEFTLICYACRSDYPPEKLGEIFPGKMAVLGYGTQGRGQALNMRDQGLDVIIGLRKGRSWEIAKEDGWVEGESLFEIKEAADKGNVIMYMLSDAGQSMMWSQISPYVTSGKTLYFSHGFSVVYKELTGTKFFHSVYTLVTDLRHV